MQLRGGGYTVADAMQSLGGEVGNDEVSENVAMEAEAEDDNSAKRHGREGAHLKERVNDSRAGEAQRRGDNKHKRQDSSKSRVRKAEAVEQRLQGCCGESGMGKHIVGKEIAAHNAKKGEESNDEERLVELMSCNIEYHVDAKIATIPKICEK